MAKVIPKLKTQQHISLDQMLKNPMGKYSAAFVRRSFARSGMQIFYLNLLKRYRHAISVQGYDVENRVMFIVMIPSETYKWNKVRYTVVIEFINDPLMKRPFVHRDMKYFSNSPAYQFIYEYVLYHRGLIPDSITPILSDIAINNRPQLRNPDETLGFEKSLYAAGRVLSEGSYLTLNYTSIKLKKITAAQWQVMIRDIPTADQLIPVLKAGGRLQAQANQNVKKKMTKPQLETAKEKVRSQSNHVIDKKSKLTKKAKISMKKAKSVKNKYNVK